MYIYINACVAQLNKASLMSVYKCTYIITHINMTTIYN